MKTKYFGTYVLISIIVFMSGYGKADEQQNQSTISVFGIGTVLVQPDVIQMNITLSNVAQTTKMAREAVSTSVRQALAILKEANIEDKNIATASLTFSPEYEYKSNKRILAGQKAEQRITFSIEGINSDNEKISRIIDQLTQINGIALNRINFTVKSNTEYYIKSRELAFKKAFEKANQYAELSKLKIVKVLSISEEANRQSLSTNNSVALRNQLEFVEVSAGEEADSAIPTGELEITTRIFVVFLLGKH